MKFAGTWKVGVKAAPMAEHSVAAMADLSEKSAFASVHSLATLGWPWAAPRDVLVAALRVET